MGAVGVDAAVEVSVGEDTGEDFESLDWVGVSGAGIAVIIGLGVVGVCV